MAFRREPDDVRTRTSTRSGARDVSMSDGDWMEQDAPPRDLKKMALVVGLGLLSWVATYIGMLELIQANMGDLPLTHKGVIGFSVAMLMIMIVWLLDQMFAPIPLATKLTYVAGYVFLTIISVGFGFGFYWKVLESRSEAARSAESAIGQVQSSLHAAATRMTQLSTTLEQLNQVSTEKAEIERTRGASCPNSRPGDGPRRKLRDEDAQRFAFAAEFVKTRVGTVNGDLTALDVDLVKIVSDDASIIDAKTGTRNEFLRTLGRKLDLTVTGFNAFRTDPQLKQLRQDLAERADKTVFPDSRGGTFACPDPQLQQALKGVVRAIDQLPDLEKPKIAAVEGSEATIEAFRRLTATLFGLASLKLPPSAEELRELQKKAVQSVEASPAVQKALAGETVAGLSKRDYVPLAIALFVDLCLLLVSMSRPMNRLGSLVPKMREAERGPVIQILSRFNEIHRDDEIRQNFEVFRHVVFDFHGAYYVAVPLDAPYKPSGPYVKGYSTEDIADLQLEAQLLANLFTSFEQERIFSRVYSPFLTTRAIKRKLLRQGSKFAHADAFRVYRFRDGAWSEIILGAVMGAARRVEAEKRKRRLEEQLFASTEEPSLTAANDHTRPDASTAPGAAARRHDADATGRNEQQQRTADAISEAAAATSGQTRRAAAGGGSGGFFAGRVLRDIGATPSEPRGSTQARDASAEAFPGAAVVDPETASGYGPYAARYAREMAEERYRATLPTLRGEDGILDRPRRRGRTRVDAGPEGEVPSGEVVLFAIPGSEAAETRDRQAAAQPSATRPVTVEAEPPPAPAPARSPDADRSTQLPPVEVTRAAEPQPRIGVIFRRETAELTLPATEARLPADLFRAAGFAALAADADQSANAIALSESERAEPARLPPPLPAGEPPAADAVEVEWDAVPVQQTAEADDVAEPIFAEPDIDIRIEDISRRFRPVPGE